MAPHPSTACSVAASRSSRCSSFHGQAPKRRIPESDVACSARRDSLNAQTNRKRTGDASIFLSFQYFCLLAYLLNKVCRQKTFPHVTSKSKGQRSSRLIPCFSALAALQSLHDNGISPCITQPPTAASRRFHFLEDASPGFHYCPHG